MKITCTGPNGEKFEGETLLIKDELGDYNPSVDRHNEAERAAVQEALETWCKMVKANPKEAEVNP